MLQERHWKRDPEQHQHRCLHHCQPRGISSCQTNYAEQSHGESASPHTQTEKAKEEEILLDWDTDEPCKAKARHVMKGFSKEGAENIEATTPQVTREGTLTVAQLVSSFQWRLGFLDFTQALHSGDPTRDSCTLNQEKASQA